MRRGSRDVHVGFDRCAEGVLIQRRALARLVCGTDYVRIYPTDAVAHVANPAFVAARVNAFLGGRLDEKSMIAAVEPALRNQGATRSPASA